MNDEVFTCSLDIPCLSRQSNSDGGFDIGYSFPSRPARDLLFFLLLRRRRSIKQSADRDEVKDQLSP